MTLADVPAVVELERMVFTSPWSRYAFEHEVQHNPNACFLVLHESASGNPAPVERAQQPLLGYGGFWMILDEAHICTLAVHPDWRGRNLGELLLVRLIEQATALEAAVVTLEVRASNGVAQNLYRKYGLIRVGLRKGYYSDNREDALIMTAEGIQCAAYQGCFQRLKKALWQRLSSKDLTD
jgi:ribosomal-protein-alanine N-acetyltransferase